MSGGKDDWVRPASSMHFPPTAPFTIHADRRGLKGSDDGEREAGAGEVRSLTDLINKGAFVSSSEGGIKTDAVTDDMEERLNAGRALGRDESDAELEEESRTSAEEYARELHLESLPLDVETDAMFAGYAEDEEPEASPEAVSDDLRSSQPVEDLAPAEKLSGPQEQAPETVIEATLAGPVGDPVPQLTIEEVVAQTTYVEDDPEDARRCAPDHRRCTSLAADGRRCRSFSMKVGAKCAGHAGIGLAADPSRYAPLASEAKRELKMMRRVVGNGAKLGPRAALRLRALTEGDALARSIMAAALDPEGGVAGANLALRVIDGIDPLVEVSHSVTSIGDVGRRLQSGAVVPFLELQRVVEQAQLEAPQDAISA